MLVEKEEYLLVLSRYIYSWRNKRFRKPRIRSSRGLDIIGNDDWVKNIIEKGLSKFKAKASEELIGVKYLKQKLSVTKIEEVVCEEFQIERIMSKCKM